MPESQVIKFDGGMTFFGSPSKEHMDKVSNFYNAVAKLMFSDHLGKECAVAIRRWYLENNVLHPEDSAPMGMLHNGCEEWSDFNDVTGGQGGDIDQMARAEWAQRRVCRALAKAVEHSDIPLIDFIQSAIPDDWDDKDDVENLLNMATRQFEKAAAGAS